MGAVRRYWLHGLPITVVKFIATGALTVSLFLFLTFYPYQLQYPHNRFLRLCTDLPQTRSTQAAC